MKEKEDTARASYGCRLGGRSQDVEAQEMCFIRFGQNFYLLEGL